MNIHIDRIKKEVETLKKAIIDGIYGTQSIVGDAVLNIERAVCDYENEQPIQADSVECNCDCYRVDDCPEYNSGDCKLKSIT